MANPEHLAILKQGVKVWNEWREIQTTRWEEALCREKKSVEDLQILSEKIDLSGTDLRGLNLTGFDFSAVNLSNADLRQTFLYKVKLDMTDLAMANLQDAIITEANFQTTWLEKTYLRSAFINFTRFWGTHFIKTDISDAHLASNTFANVDLSKMRGLDTIVHLGPSTIGIDTIFRSGGNIPEVFLRGCGVPDIFIEYAHSLVGKPIQLYSCFISHSSKDKRFCERLYADLQAKSVRVWYFPEDAKWGESVWGEIDRSIKIYDKLVVVCSKNSLTSGPVLREIERALNREDKEGKHILFPIRIDDYLFDEWEHPRKNDVLAKIVGDFRGWNRSAAKYDEAFKKLLKALQA